MIDKVYPSNVISRRLTQSTIKIWQRLIAAAAGQDVEERKKEAAIDLKETMLTAYHAHAKEVLNTFSTSLPNGITMKHICGSTFSQMTGLIYYLHNVPCLSYRLLIYHIYKSFYHYTSHRNY
jgi:hypothetical protein